MIIQQMPPVPMNISLCDMEPYQLQFSIQIIRCERNNAIYNDPLFSPKYSEMCIPI